MAKIIPYLNVPNAKKAIEVYKTLFGATVVSHTPYSPDMPGLNLPTNFDYANSTMHAVLNINGAEFYLTDTIMGPVPSGPNRVNITIDLDSKEQLDAIWKKVKAAAYKIDIDLQKTMWGALFGIFTDPFGIGWMLNFQVEPLHLPGSPAKAPAKKAARRQKKVLHSILS